MKYAIYPRGVGNKPRARAIEDAWELEAGETFSVAEAGYTPALVLAENGVSLRASTTPELLAIRKSERTEEFKIEANARIATFYAAAQHDLLTAELNQLAATLNVVHELADGAELDAPQLAIIAAAQTSWAGISAIRTAEAVAVAAVAGAADIAAVNAVTASWP